MKLKVKKVDSGAKMPAYARPGDAGMDLFALERVVVPAGKSARIRTGVAVEIPEGYVGLHWDKSGISMNHSIKSLAGVIDSGFRGEVITAVFNFGTEDYIFEKHHKVVQMLIQAVESPEIIETQELSKSVRGEAGFGSSGK